jgi:hypothetical protein
MKVAILIMSGNQEPSLRNVETLKETMVKNSVNWNLINNYNFFAYSYKESAEPEDTVLDCIKDERYPNCYDIHISGTETVYRTYEKTYDTYKYLLDNEDKYGKYDWFVRINISCYVNMKLLDIVLKDMKKDTIYANALNSYVDYNFQYCNYFYPRGDFYIVSHENLEEIMKVGEKLMYCDTWLKNRPALPHVDDTLFGYAFILAVGKDCFKRLQMIQYNFLPMTSDNAKELKDSVIGNFNKKAIASRVKSVPPGNVSGYSWDDNKFRLYDPMKMKIVDELVSEIKYESVTLNDILVSPLQERPTLYINASNATPSQIVNIINL